MKLALETINLPDLIRVVIDLYEIIAEEKKITIHANLPDELRIEADRVRLQQALANLIDNAIKYTPPGGRVEVSAEQDDQQVVIRVKDTGMGISTEDLPRIWDRLYRGDKSRSQKAWIGPVPGQGSGSTPRQAACTVNRGNVVVHDHPAAHSIRFDWLSKQNNAAAAPNIMCGRQSDDPPVRVARLTFISSLLKRLRKMPRAEKEPERHSQCHQNNASMGLKPIKSKEIPNAVEMTTTK